MTSPTEETNLPTADELRLLEPAAVRFRTVGHRLEVCLDDDSWQESSLLRMFPLSEEYGWLAVLNADGKELGVLRDLHGLAHDSLAAVREELRRRYLVPRITAILAVRDRADVTEWRVETDRGPATFQVRHLSENLKQPLPGHLSLTDVEGNRYDIPDLAALDDDSRRRLEERM
ncbi:MAG: hypothetical protein BWY76_00042 [bacterium ADurb.Bin429]|nr:MAG: hypothetical protein BWY76_00042 [bacterium ADurb.Bin429]